MLTSVSSGKKYLLLVVVLCLLGLAALILLGTFKKLPSSLQDLTQKKPSVVLKTEYKNPFVKDTQYVNPFAENKNPFVTNR